MSLKLKAAALFIAALMMLPAAPAFAAETDADVIEPTDYIIRNNDELQVKSGNVLLYSEYDNRYL